MRTLLAVLMVLLLGMAGADDPPAKNDKPPYERRLQGDDAKTAAALDKRITELEEADQYAEAVQVAEELATLRARVQGTDHWESRDARERVRTLQQVRTLPTTARAQLREATQATQQAHGYFDQGKYAAAQPLYEKALAICRQTLGEQYRRTAQGYNNLALNLNAQGKYAAAQPLFEKALAIHRQVLGEQHAGTATAYNNLALNLYAQGKYAAAQPLYEKALALWRQALGAQHPHIATAYNNLASNLDAQGKYPEAQPLLEKALAIRRQALGEQARGTATSYNNLALNLQAQGKYAEAQPLYEKALAIRRQALGAQHPDTATSYNNLASNLKAQGKYAEAQPLCERTLAIRRQALGEQHPQTATAYNNLAANLHNQGKDAEAQPLFEKALAISRRAFGEQHPDTATAYNNLAYNLGVQGKYAEAQPLFEKALAIRRQALGEQHPQTATVYNNLASNLHVQGKYAAAQPLYERALATSRQALGEQHPQTATDYNNLAVNLYAQGKYAAARAALEQASHSYETSRLAAAQGLDRAVALRSPYPAQVAVLARLDRRREAWQALQRDLARGLLDAQAGRRERLLQPAERTRQTSLTQQLASIGPRILDLLIRPQRSSAEQRELDELTRERRQLDADLADLAAALSQREVAAFDAVRKAVPADAALVAWIDLSLPGMEEHWGCVLHPTGDPAWERLPGTGSDHQWTKQDTELPRRLRLALAGDRTTAPAPAAEVAAIAHALDGQRLAPLQKHLLGVRRLYVVPVGSMAGLPVEVLSDRYRINYVPSGTFLARLKDRARPNSERVLAVGDPRFEGDSVKLPSLPAPLPPGGLLVTRVLPNSSAAGARITPQDVLLRYADTDLNSVEQLPRLVSDHAGDKTVAVTVWRDGKTTVRRLAPGKLGVVLAKEPAPKALVAKREADRLLASLRGGAWQELPGTRIELARLTRLFGPDKVTILADAAATEPALEALRTGNHLKEYRYLHFATHGEANNVQALESRLILTQDAAAKAALPHAGQPTLDGMLTAREVLDFWNLDAELVTLSACETALGREGGGDGLLGFAQAFLTAGSRAVCLSLWKVDDTATALLMDRFYQNLTGKRAGLTGPMGKAAALAEAKQWLRGLSVEEAAQRLGTITAGVARGKGQKALDVVVPPVEAKTEPKAAKPFAHPKYWAAFVLIGDPN